MTHIRVGVLRGGPSNEYDTSLRTGAEILRHLQSNKQHIYHTHDIFVDKNGMWHLHGRPKSVADIIPQFDVIVNAMHGEYGEDGKVQRELERHNIPFTGSKSFQSSIRMNKDLAKRLYKEHGIKTPYYMVVAEPKPGAPFETVHALAKSLFHKFPLPVVVKPVASGSSVGVRLAKSFGELEQALSEIFKISTTAIIEEFVNGTEASVGIVESFREQPIYSLPPIEVPSYFHDKFGGIKNVYQNRRGRVIKSPFHDREINKSENFGSALPGNFTQAQKTELEELARKAHQILDLRHYSRSDFIIHPKRGIYIIETNPLPGMTNDSLMPHALTAVGVPLSDFLEHIIQLALKQK